MGFTGSIFSMRSNWVGRCFAQNGPQDWENPLFRALWPILGLKMAKSFQCAPLEGGTKGQKRKKIVKIALFSTQTHFLKPQQKIKFSTCFSIFFGSKNFWPENGSVFSVCTAPIGCTKGRKRKKIALFSTKTHFLEAATKNQHFFDFFRV